jgi:hypothetical protein
MEMQSKTAQPNDLSLDLSHLCLEVTHARGVLTLLYQAIESGELVATGPLDASSLVTVIRKAIHSARDVEAALDRLELQS